MSGGGLGVVLGGGGACAAYQAGVLDGLVRRVPDLRPDILHGVSAGAVNAIHLANHEGAMPERTADLVRCWERIRIDEVFESRGLALLWRMLRSGLRLTVGWPSPVDPLQGMVDTRPLRRFLKDALGSGDGTLPALRRNLDRSVPRAVGLTATCYATGQTVTFVAGKDVPTWRTGKRIGIRDELTVDHVLASSALPLFFPPIPIDGVYYGDGGIRLVAPLGPALHLGADRILAVSTSHVETPEQAALHAFAGPPAPIHVMGVLYDAIFLDQLDRDAMTLERINGLLREAPEDRRHGLREVELVVVRPSQDLRALANEFELRLPWMFRHLTRRLGSVRTRNQDFLSTVMFHEEYIARLLDLGRRDGEERAAEIAARLGLQAGG